MQRGVPSLRSVELLFIIRIGASMSRQANVKGFMPPHKVLGGDSCASSGATRCSCEGRKSSTRCQPSQKRLYAVAQPSRNHDEIRWPLRATRPRVGIIERAVTDCEVWPAPGSEDTELGVFMGPEVGHGETKIYAGVQA
jgi:hypothetical protein